MVNALKRTFRLSWRANMANRRSIPHDDVIKLNRGRAGWRQKGSEPLEHCVDCDPKRSSRQRKTRNALFEQSREGAMDRGLCGERDCGGKKASWRRRDSDQAEGRRYEQCWKCGIDHQRAWKDIGRDAECYWRQSERSCKFRRWGWRGRCKRRRSYRAGKAEGRWRTRVGDEHNLQNGTTPHAEGSVEADESWRIDTSGMGGRGRLLLQKR